MRVVIDTNVLVSSVLSPHGPPRTILRLFLTRQIDWLVNDPIMAEYREALSREKFGFEAIDAADLLWVIQSRAIQIPFTPEKIALTDRADLPFLLCAKQGKADALITGNRKHFKSIRGFTTPIDLPSEFLIRISR